MDEKVAIGSDHRGFKLKQSIKALLESLGKNVEDVGAFSEESADYPEFARSVGQCISKRTCDRGILICGSGIGMSVTANKFPGVRAALCHDLHTAEMCRRHNDANVLVLGESVGQELAREMVKLWLATPFEGGRHQKRLDIIQKIEQENFK